ncbi:hypothetical protein [Thiosulfatihalobacter marinus]|uniref:hypothetical protein n=1 Tax=Thiosulfatihalobacter marinus TaxID=2792481 RepID=UPI0018D5BE58|nr:hypothetical protein [Thiosulfatihalobacter marinus]
MTIAAPDDPVFEDRKPDGRMFKGKSIQFHGYQKWHKPSPRPSECGYFYVIVCGKGLEHGKAG